MNDNEAIINIDNLRFRYIKGTSRALDKITTQFKPGEFVVIMGPSRAGKSTLCLTMNGLIPLYLKGIMKGTVTVCGKKTIEHKVNELAKDVAMVFQDFESQLFSTSAALDVAFGPENFGMEHEKIVQAVNDSMKMVGLDGFEKREPATLSGGEKQRLAIAAALAMGSTILVMDEPTTDLDPIGKISIFDVAARLRDTREHTIIYVEHETEETISADRIILLSEGKILLDGAPRDVLTQVDLLRQNGIMPLGVAEVSHALKIDAKPLTVEEGVDILKENKYEVSVPAYNKLVSQDKERTKKYGDPVVEVKDLTFWYDEDIKALDNVNLTIRKGEFLAIIGQNGSGKTTLAKQFNGLLKPTEGTVMVGDMDTKDSTIYKLSKYTGYVFQNPDHQIFAETVSEEVSFGPKNFGFSEEDIKESVQEALSSVDLIGSEEEDPFLLTKGERQRVAVASVLATRPKIIILDEPTTGLDYSEQVGIMNLLKRLNEEGHTVVIITHTMWVVSHYAHRGIVMNKGKIVLEGSIRDIFKNEAKLTDLSLRPPQIVRLSNQFGHTMLTTDEMVQCLQKK